ncbi:type I-G CRISPR-associated RAMP protein Csb1/Cas7g [Alicyclobacillus acidoterrestris]|uniref:type I-G CRISPR-associated RAMP protein Csb1/Cas7g n=1 Tax=Alicyclobacillus acidoterrestris TaxID=1450 RepID=UPI003F53568A
MAIDYNVLKDAPRLLIEAHLEPAQGTRFQATGFPDLGPAQYRGPEGSAEVLVESAQSMANRLEKVCWDDLQDDWVEPLKGLPLIRVVSEDGVPLTNSVLEAHRINSSYIVESKDTTVFDMLKARFGNAEIPVNLREFAQFLLQHDPNSLLHGVFMSRKELAGGRLRLPRMLSAFIEAHDVNDAHSGGVKNDHVNPAGDANKGFGNIPFHRTEFTSSNIVAYFNVDLTQLFSLDLGVDAENFLISFALFKIQRFLAYGLRLRTACDLRLKTDGLVVMEPTSFTLPTLSELSGDLTDKIASLRAAGILADAIRMSYQKK